MEVWFQNLGSHLFIMMFIIFSYDVIYKTKNYVFPQDVYFFIVLQTIKRRCKGILGSVSSLLKLLLHFSNETQSHQFTDGFEFRLAHCSD